MSSSKKLPYKVRVVMVKSAEETPRQAATVLRKGQPVKTDIANASEETTSQTARIVGETETQSFKSDVTNARAGEETFHTATMLRKAQPVKIEEVWSDEETSPIISTVQNKARTYDLVKSRFEAYEPGEIDEMDEMEVIESQSLEIISLLEETNLRTGRNQSVKTDEVIRTVGKLTPKTDKAFSKIRSQSVRSEVTNNTKEALSQSATVHRKARAHFQKCEPQAAQPGKQHIVKITESLPWEILTPSEKITRVKDGQQWAKRDLASTAAGEASQTVHNKAREHLKKSHLQTAMQEKTDFTEVTESESLEILSLSDDLNASHKPKRGNSKRRRKATSGITMLQKINKERKSDIDVKEKTKKSVMYKWFNQPKITKVKPFKPETTPKEKKKENGHSKINQLRMLVGRLISRLQNAITCGQI